MQRKAAKHLEDIRDAAAFIRHVTRAKGLDEYRSDRLLRQAVERNFEIIGEGVNRLTRDDPDIAGQIAHASKIVAFRNVLIHGYDLVDDARVWDMIQSDVPDLERQVESVLGGVENDA